MDCVADCLNTWSKTNALSSGCSKYSQLLYSLCVVSQQEIGLLVVSRSPILPKCNIVLIPPKMCI